MAAVTGKHDSSAMSALLGFAAAQPTGLPEEPDDDEGDAGGDDVASVTDGKGNAEDLVRALVRRPGPAHLHLCTHAPGFAQSLPPNVLACCPAGSFRAPPTPPS
eukprot:scaffold22350_cov124-Isochrysis_galbana.AAC.6